MRLGKHGRVKVLPGIILPRCWPARDEVLPKVAQPEVRFLAGISVPTDDALRNPPEEEPGPCRIAHGFPKVLHPAKFPRIESPLLLSRLYTEFDQLDSVRVQPSDHAKLKLAPLRERSVADGEVMPLEDCRAERQASEQHKRDKGDGDMLPRGWGGSSGVDGRPEDEESVQTQGSTEDQIWFDRVQEDWQMEPVAVMIVDRVVDINRPIVVHPVAQRHGRFAPAARPEAMVDQLVVQDLENRDLVNVHDLLCRRRALLVRRGC